MKKWIVGLMVLGGIVFFSVLTISKSSSVREAEPLSPTERVVEEAKAPAVAPVVISEEPAQAAPFVMDETLPVVVPEHVMVTVDGLPSEWILDERITELENGDVQRLFLINGGGTYPFHRVEELLRYDAEQAKYTVVRQRVIVADHFLVNLHAGCGEAELEVLNRRFGTSTLQAMGFANKYMIQLSEPSIDGVFDVSARFAAEKEFVKRVHTDSISAPTRTTPNDPWFGPNSWNLERPDAPEAWDRETGSANVIVAIIDTGVDIDHRDLAANIWENPGEAGALASNGVDDDGNGYIDDWIGWDFGQADNDPDDNGDEDYDGTFSKGGHGTHCAGITGAVGNNGVDVVGVCWTVSIMALKAAEYIPASDGMATFSSKAEAAMIYATDNGAKITSNSYGDSGDGEGYYDGINYQNSNGVLFIAASGNGGGDASGDDNDATAYEPAGVDLPNVISVAASDMGDDLSSYSNYGLKTVDLAAPGGEAANTILSTLPNDTIGGMAGTSMATPQVAGAAALLYSAYPDLPPLYCKQALMDGVETFAAFSNKCVSEGRLNIDQSLTLLDGYMVSAPVEGEIWPPLVTKTIQWFTANTSGLSRISVYQNGSSVFTIATDVANTTGVYEWTVTDSLPIASNYQIRVEDMSTPSDFAESDPIIIGPLFPYTESFESGLGLWENVMGDDFNWTRHSGSTGILTGPTNANQGTYYVYAESYSHTPSETAHFEADFPFELLEKPEITFAYHMRGSTMGNLFLEVSTNGGAAWNTEWSRSGEQGEQWFTGSVMLTDYAGAPVKIRFRAVTGSSDNSDIAVDSISISNRYDRYDMVAPLANATWEPLSTQTIDWVTVNTNGLSRISIVQNGSNVFTVATNVAKADETYEWIVTDSLPSASGYSVRIEDMDNPSHFAESDPFFIRPWFPYVQSFEDGLGIWEQDAADGLDWDRNSGETPSFNTGPTDADHGTWYVYTEVYFLEDRSTNANLEADFPFELLENPEISFAYHMYGSSMGSLYLEVSTNSGAAWTTEWSLSGDQGNQWFQTNVNLSTYAGAPVTLRFRGLTGNEPYSDMAIDSITIDNGTVQTAELVTDLSELNVPEGSTNGFQVKLSVAPSATVTVNVARISGDPDITVSSGDSLEFTTGNWGTYQPVTLIAAEDDDWVSSSTVVRCSSPGMSDVDITATETENDENPAFVLPFSETFEERTLGDLNGQHGWTGDGTVQAGTVYEGTQALALTNGTAAHTFDGDATNIWVTFWAQPTVSEAPPEDIPANASAVFYMNTNRQLVAYNSTNATVIELALFSNDWNEITVSCDFISKVWNLSLNDVPRVGNFDFYGLPASFQALEIIENTTNALFVDSITVTDSQNDSDGDGLPDSWEEEYYGGATNAIATNTCANGINTIEEAYVAGLNPTNSSSVFVMTQLGSDAGDLNRTVLQWSMVSGRVYSIYWASNLTSGFPAQPFTNGISAGAFTDSVHGAANDGFYKIEVDLE